MTAEEIFTPILLRLQEAHRERSGHHDMDVGYRLGLLHALNIVQMVRSDLEAAERLRRGKR